MSNRYFGSWGNYDDMAGSFNEGAWDYEKSVRVPAIIPKDFPKDEEVLFATYDHGGYEGSAQVIYVRDGQLMEIQASHCSCNGLEGQGDGSPVTWESLALRIKEMESDRYGYLDLSDSETREAFAKLVQDHVSGQAALTALNK